jgi:DNA invertase Pin-like site-specific DNA recombinase
VIWYLLRGRSRRRLRRGCRTGVPWRRPSGAAWRQRAAIASFAKAHSYRIVDEFYDAAVSGADPVAERPGFKAMLDRIAGNGVRVILVESPDRFARDLSVQITGHDYLRSLGVELVPTSAPDFFTTDTPTAVLVRQVLGAVSQFEKANLVAKLRAAARAQDRGRRPRQWALCLCSEGARGGRAGARATWTAAIAAADIEDARRARSSHGRWQAVYCDCGAEDAARRIEAGPDLANLPLARMPLFDSQWGVDGLASVRSQRMHARFMITAAPLRAAQTPFASHGRS